MKKKILAVLGSALLIISLVLTGCGSSNQPAAKDTKPILLRVGYIFATDNDADKGAQKFKELVEKNSKGRIEVQTFTNSQLGSENDMINSLSAGSLEMEVSGEGVITGFEPGFGALTMPFAFRDLDHMLKVFNGPIGKQLDQAFIKDKGVHVLSIWARGPRYLTANKEIKTPDDLQGVKIRVPVQTTSVETWKRLGGITTAMNLSELYSALQQGVVSAQENPLDLVYTSSYYQVQKYVMETRHSYVPYVVTMSNKFYTGLPDDLKKVVDDAAQESSIYVKDLVVKGESQYRADLEKKGMKFVPVDRQLFMDKMKGLPEEVEKTLKWIPGQYQEIVNTK